ncbi:MAG: MFS transporter [Bdellovibrionales bacterium]|nr:MFS transporter [Bdellovibrionales bacterium]
MRPTLEPLSRKELLLLLLLAGVQFTHIMDFMILMPLGSKLMRIFEIEPLDFGLLVAAYNFAAGAAGFAGAFFLDRFDRKKALLVSYFAFTIGTLACAVAPNYYALLIARSFAGLFGGVMGALVMSIVGDAISPSKRGRAMGLVMASFSLASVFGVPFGIVLANHFDWHAPFLFVGLISVLIGVIGFFYLPSMSGHLQSRESRPTPYHVLHRVITNPLQMRALLLTTLLTLGQFLVIPFIAPSLVANVGFREDQLPLMYLIGGGLTIFSSPLVGRMCDKIGRTPVFTVFGLLVLLPTFLLTNLGQTPIAYVLAISALFFVASNGRFVPAWAMITSTVKPEARGSFLSLNSSVQSLAGGAGSFIASLIVVKATDGQLANFEIVGYFSILVGISALFIGRGLKPIE